MTKYYGYYKQGKQIHQILVVHKNTKKISEKKTGVIYKNFNHAESATFELNKKIADNIMVNH